MTSNSEPYSHIMYLIPKYFSLYLNSEEIYTYSTTICHSMFTNQAIINKVWCFLPSMKWAKWLLLWYRQQRKRSIEKTSWLRDSGIFKRWLCSQADCTCRKSLHTHKGAACRRILKLHMIISIANVPINIQTWLNSAKPLLC